MHYAAVILDNAVDQLLDYAIPESLQEKAKPGMRVLVPLRGRLCKGTIFHLKSLPEIEKVLSISELLSEKALLPRDLIELAAWMANYYCAPLHKILKIFLPPPIRQGKKEKQQLFVKSSLSANEMKELCENLRLSHPSQAAVLEVLLKLNKGILLTELIQEAKVSRSPIETLINKKILTVQPLTIDRSPLLTQDFFQTKPKTLNPEQEEAFKRIRASLEARRFETHLLFGVTGSGKTEIYLQAIEQTLLLGKGAIFLVPEIALTSQTVERLRSRFQEKIVLLHHRLSSGERRDSWQKISDGTASIVIGARSALFSPLPSLGLIIVDEEHDPSYKQSEETPCYHARDVAVMRGKFCHATVILGSATPSLESFYNAEKGKYLLSTLTARPQEAKLPQISLVDMKQEYAKAKGFTLFSEPLLEAIKKRIAIGEQCLLFLNRRGYHTAKQCLVCSHILHCPHCDLSLTFHLGENLLACHLCDYRLKPPPRTCPQCQSEGFKYKGVGTEHVEQSLHAIFPQIRTLRLDGDTTRHKGSHERLFKQFRSGKADLLIGTQMIAKGLHFPAVTLVGILNVDQSLQLPDFRASETLFQLLMQVSGRAGRGELAGEVLIQTAMPSHPIIQNAKNQDFISFYRNEIETRKCFDYPPFSHFIKFVFSGPCLQTTENEAQNFRKNLIQKLPASFQFFPIIPCGRAKIKDRYRFQFLLKGEKIGSITQLLTSWQKSYSLNKKVHLLIDVDPFSTYF